MRLRAGLLLALVCALGAAPRTASAVRVFANPYPGNGTYQGSLQYGASTKTFDLYVEIGTINGADPPCRLNTPGDELCAYHVTFQVDGTGYITIFTPAPCASCTVKSWPTTFTSSSRSLAVTVVGVNPAIQTTPTPVKIGTITVNGTASGGAKLLVTGKKVVDNGLSTRTIPSDTLVVLPEPGAGAALAAGVLALVLMRRARSNHARPS